MRPTDNIHSLIKKLHLKAGAELDQRLRAEIRRALDEQRQTKPAATRPKIWRIIMKSRITKLAAAAAVIVALAAIGFFSQIGVTSNVYAMSNVPELFETAKTIHMAGRMYFPSVEPAGGILSIEVQYWLDLENERWRLSRPFYVSTPEATKVHISEVISDGEYEVRVDHTDKSASFSKLSPFQRRLFVRKNVHTLLQYLCGDPRLLDDYTRVGEELIAGQTFDIWEVVKEVYSGPDIKLKAWLSPETGEFAKVVFSQRAEDTVWEKIMEIASVERDVDIPDEVFTIVPPPAYTLKNDKDTATPKELTHASVSNGTVTLNCHILFAMLDGTVIAGWSSENTESEVSQAELFAELQFGGELPKEPVEVAGLKPISADGHTTYEQTTYKGYHLAYTQKAGRFYEWSIYVANKTVEPADVWGYQLQLESNLEGGEANARLSIAAIAELTIQDEEDFNSLVLGAMAECSAAGVAPDGLTYENVLALVEQIRASITK